MKKNCMAEAAELRFWLFWLRWRSMDAGRSFLRKA